MALSRCTSSANGAVLLDKDGTLLENLPYNVDPARMRLAPGAAAGLRRLGQRHLRLVVISNQPGVALGYFSEKALIHVRNRLAQLFEQQGATLAGFFYCPHHPDGTVARYTRTCLCRKPGCGLLRKASRQLGFSLRHSWLVGDILDDIAAARQAECRAILIDCGNETEWRLTPQRMPHHTVADFDMAARIIVSQVRGRRPAQLVAAATAVP